LTAKLDWDAKRVTPQAVLELAKSDLESLNAEVTRRAASRCRQPEWRAALEVSFRQVVRELGHRPDFTGVVPRRSLVNPYLDAAASTGSSNRSVMRFILDSHVLASRSPSCSRTSGRIWPASRRIGGQLHRVLACLRSDMPAIRYSGWLHLSFYFAQAVCQSRRFVAAAIASRRQ